MSLVHPSASRVLVNASHIHTNHLTLLFFLSFIFKCKIFYHSRKNMTYARCRTCLEFESLDDGIVDLRFVNTGPGSAASNKGSRARGLRSVKWGAAACMHQLVNVALCTAWDLDSESKCMETWIICFIHLTGFDFPVKKLQTLSQNCSTAFRSSALKITTLFWLLSGPEGERLLFIKTLAVIFIASCILPMMSSISL